MLDKEMDDGTRFFSARSGAVGIVPSQRMFGLAPRSSSSLLSLRCCQRRRDEAPSSHLATRSSISSGCASSNAFSRTTSLFQRHPAKTRSPPRSRWLLQRLDVRLQLGPGRESIFARDHSCASASVNGDAAIWSSTGFSSADGSRECESKPQVLWLLAFQQGLGLFPELFKTGARRKLPDMKSLSVQGCVARQAERRFVRL